MYKHFFQYDEEQTTHTVHLVCSQPEFMSSSDSSGTPPSSRGSPVTTPPSTPRANSDGLRHRHTAPHRTQESSPDTTTPVYPAPNEAFQQFYG